jgi:hypothetical protein
MMMNKKTTNEYAINNRYSKNMTLGISSFRLLNETVFTIYSA